jgi:hypothetical protein
MTFVHRNPSRPSSALGHLLTPAPAAGLPSRSEPPAPRRRPPTAAGCRLDASPRSEHLPDPQTPRYVVTGLCCLRVVMDER